jgi:hypothetical protein
MDRFARYALISLSLLGTLAGGSLSIEHLQMGEVCPILGPVPACFVVFVGYVLILVNAVFASKLNLKTLFFLGWNPIFLLAAMGVSLEVFGQDICPPGAMGIPQCFYSLAMALLCLGLFLIMNRRQGTA